eukprot:Awhi_evm1s4697
MGRQISNSGPRRGSGREMRTENRFDKQENQVIEDDVVDDDVVIYGYNNCDNNHIKTYQSDNNCFYDKNYDSLHSNNHVRNSYEKNKAKNNRSNYNNFNNDKNDVKRSDRSYKRHDAIDMSQKYQPLDNMNQNQKNQKNYGKYENYDDDDDDMSSFQKITHAKGKRHNDYLINV